MKTSHSVEIAGTRGAPGAQSFPLSFWQERSWLLHHLHPGSPGQNLYEDFSLSGNLDIPALEHAFREVVRRHGSLRTSFSAEDGDPRQIVHEHVPFSLRQVDLAELGPLEQREAVEAVLADHHGRPFDLAEAPLLRVVLIRLALDRHILSYAIHHIVADDWSLAILKTELGALGLAGEAATLPDLGAQYTDFVRWQRERLDRGALEELVSYWRDRLDGAPSVLELAISRPRPSMPSHVGDHVYVRLDRSLAEELISLARRSRSTIFAVFVAAFAVLLARYADQDDVSLGTYVSTRPRREFRGLIGMFVNTLVLRIRVQPELSFSELLADARRVVLDALSHQELPFEVLLQELGVKRAPDRTPLFQAMIALQNGTPPVAVSGPAHADLGGVDATPLVRPRTWADFDLTLWIWEAASSLVLDFDYAVELFERAAVERLAHHFERLLEAVVTAPEAPVCSLELLTSAEREQLVQRWSRTPPWETRATSLAQLFEAQAARTPLGCAVRSGRTEVSYRELDERSDALAATLHTYGVGPEVPVGLCLERSPELVVAVLAILKAGGAYLPLDPDYPPERLAFMLRDAGAELVVTTTRHAHGLAQTGARLALLDELEPPGAGATDRPRFDLPVGSTPAYIVYTSGSSGGPRAVVVTNEAAANFVLGTCETYGYSSSDSVLALAPLTFDGHVEEIFPCLVTGGTLVLAEEVEHGLPLVQRLAREAITIVSIPTPLWHVLPNVLPPDARLPDTLRLVLIGSEEARADVLPLWRRVAAKRTVLINTYGPTETTCVVLRSSPLEHDLERVPLGKPVPGVRAYVLDDTLALVPPGVPGTIYVGGAALARGYHGDPAATARAFVPNPLGPPGSRLYRTGDRAFYEDDGTLYFLGRRDRQVKVRGFRVELGEVEAALRRHPAVREVVVAADRDDVGSSLTAYFVTHAGTTLASSEARAFLSRTLPEFMVPSRLHEVEALPLTTSGKIDRARLAQLAAPREGPTPPRPAATPTEESLAEIWRSVLPVRDFGVTDDFFDLGGHSLLAMQVSYRVEQRFGTRVNLRWFFEAPTIAEFVVKIEESGQAPLPPLRRFDED